MKTGIDQLLYAHRSQIMGSAVQRLLPELTVHSPRHCESGSEEASKPYPKLSWMLLLDQSLQIVVLFYDR
jgi:hypothetical protein